MQPRAERLSFRRLRPGGVDALLRLATDDHVKRWLLDGHTVDRAWAEQEVARSDALFAAEGFGLWLVSGAAADAPAPIGFAGFRVFEEIGPEPQLLYALLEAFTGRGYATEAGRALLELAFARPERDRVVSAVDEPNRASLRVLEKLGFRRTRTLPGHFGTVVVMECRRDPPTG